MFWIVAASVFTGMLLSTCLAVVMMKITAASNRAREPIYVRDRK